MLDFSSIDPRLLDAVDLVVDEIVSKTSLDPTSVLLVGATCRDVLHAGLGHTFTLRGTNDLDLGIAVSGWEGYREVADAFPLVGHTGIRHLISGLAVDVMPFGPVEQPTGVVTPSPRDEPFSVFAFQDVHERALPLELPCGASIRIPTPAGYAALKMRAWIDRSPNGEYKDGGDIAISLHWYRESPVVEDRLYETDEGIRILEEVGFDVARGAARVLGVDVREGLASENLADLIMRWSALDQAQLSRELGLPADVSWTADLDQRAQFLEEIGLGLSGQHT